MALPVITFANFADLFTYINDNIRPNGLELITGTEHNAVEQGLLTFIEQSPLNWQTSDIVSTGGAVNAARPVTVIMSAVPTSITWSNNIYNQYVFINTTLGDIPLLSGTVYYDINLQPVTIIPKKSIVNIFKAKNNNWIVGSVPSSGSLSSVPPLIGVVDGGGIDDPVSGQPIFQDDKLIGLGATNDAKIQITIAEVVQSNFGSNASFSFDNVLGIIDLTPNEWIPGNGLYINLNQ